MVDGPSGVVVVCALRGGSICSLVCTRMLLGHHSALVEVMGRLWRCSIVDVVVGDGVGIGVGVGGGVGVGNDGGDGDKELSLRKTEM